MVVGASAIDLRLDDLRGETIVAFLHEHLADMYASSPPESVHALDLGALRQPDITFWSAWRDQELVGCGALKALDATHGEIKSMRVKASARGTGVADLVLRRIIDSACARGMHRLSLETGVQDFFAPARRLYQRHGFTVCGPFNGYWNDPNSVFMTRRIDGAPST